jgi:dTDP-4-dehydrorhamnose 3,5-epimerase
MTINRVSEIDGIRIIQANLVSDTRGTFVKFQPLIEFENSLDSTAFSLNPHVGTIRGMHFQVEPFAEEKLVTCVQGSIFDVVVDLRPNSESFGMWTSFELSASNAKLAYLPKGVAHGYQTLAPNTIVHYSISSPYSAESSYAINPFGGGLHIDWPLKVHLLSERDSSGISLSAAGQKYAESLIN